MMLFPLSSRQAKLKGKERLPRETTETHLPRRVWSFEGKELWKDIDRKRQAIVHEEDIPEINQDYLLQAINYLQRIMMGIAMNAQVDQGVKFTWGTISNYVKSKDGPTLKP